MEKGEVPGGWITCRLGEVIELAYGKSLPAAARDTNGPNSVYGSNGPVGVHSNWLVEGPAIIVGRKGSAGAVHYSPRNCWPIDTTYFVRDSADYDLRFVYFLLLHLRLKDLERSTAVPGLNRGDAYSLTISLPPLDEQKRIVEKIETLFAELDKGEEALRAVQKLLARYRQSVLKAAVTGTLTADWRAVNPPTETGQDLLTRILEARRRNWQGRGQYSEPVEPETEGLPELPQGWAWASLDQLLGHLTSGSRDWKQYYGRGSGTFIMAQNVRPMRFDLSQRFLVDPPPRSPDAARSQVALDDLLITIVGANTGDVCRFPLDIDEHYVCQSVALMRLVDTELSPFIEFFLSAKGAGRDQLEKHIYGAGRPHLSFEQLRSVAIPMPPKNECAELMRLASEAVANVARAEALCKSEAKRSTALRQSILKDAFSGKLVPQDPSDEPAAKLLERIRAARADKAVSKRKELTK